MTCNARVEKVQILWLASSATTESSETWGRQDVKVEEEEEEKKKKTMDNVRCLSERVIMELLRLGCTPAQIISLGLLPDDARARLEILILRMLTRGEQAHGRGGRPRRIYPRRTD